MTASPTPPDFFAESANKSAEHHASSAYCSDAQVGLPSEEEIARVLFERGRDVHDARTWEEANVEMREWLKGHATAILDLIRPAFEAVEHECQSSMMEIARERARADAAEAKLAQVVEALGPFADYYGGHYPDTDDKGAPLPDDAGVGWPPAPPQPWERRRPTRCRLRTCLENRLRAQ